jgi:hypothetical protein
MTLPPFTGNPGCCITRGTTVADHTQKEPTINQWLGRKNILVAATSDMAGWAAGVWCATILSTYQQKSTKGHRVPLPHCLGLGRTTQFGSSTTQIHFRVTLNIRDPSYYIRVTFTYYIRVTFTSRFLIHTGDFYFLRCPTYLGFLHNRP